MLFWCTAVWKPRLQRNDPDFPRWGPLKGDDCYSKQSKNNSGNASPTLLTGSLFPILPTWLSLHWHPLWGKCHRDPRDHQVFSIIRLRQQHSSRSTMPVSQWFVTCQGNFRPWLQASSRCTVTRRLARRFCWLWTLCIHLFPTFPLLPAQDSSRRPLYDLTSAGSYDFK